MGKITINPRRLKSKINKRLERNAELIRREKATINDLEILLVGLPTASRKAASIRRNLIDARANLEMLYKQRTRLTMQLHQKGK